MANEFQERAEVVRKYVEQRRDLVQHAKEVMHMVQSSCAGCDNCAALMAVLDDLLAPEVDGHA